MSLFKMPLTNTPQQFAMTFGEKEYTVICKWNDAEEGGWLLDFFDALTNLPIIYGVPLVAGVDLFSGLEYLGFNGVLFVYTDGDDFAVPTLINLGVESNVYFSTDAF